MENIEIKLKELILSKYKSLLDFTKTIGMPYSTLDSIFKRGVRKANIDNIIRICVALNISAEDLAKGSIVYNNLNPNLNTLKNSPSILLKYNQLNAVGKAKAEAYIDDLISSKNYSDDICATVDKKFIG